MHNSEPALRSTKFDKRNILKSKKQGLGILDVQAVNKADEVVFGDLRIRLGVTNQIKRYGVVADLDILVYINEERTVSYTHLRAHET